MKAVSLYFAIVFLDILATLIKVRYIKGNLFYFADINSALALMASVYMFFAFKQLKIGHSKIINVVASTTFGIYLLHDSNLLRKFIWHDLLNVKQFYGSDFLPLYAVISVVLVFSVCGIIDFLRSKFLESHYNKWLAKVKF